MAKLNKKAYAKKKWQEQVKKMGAKGKLGAGGRFKAIEEKAKKYGAENPEAVAAAVGRKKWGKKKFQAMAVAGRKQAGASKKTSSWGSYMKG